MRARNCSQRLLKQICRTIKSTKYCQVLRSCIPSSENWILPNCKMQGFAHTEAVTTLQQQQRSFYGPLSGTTRVSQYQKKHSPNHHLDHHPAFLSLFHLLRSIASSLFKLRAWQSFCTTSLHVLFRLPLGLEPSTSYPYISSPNQCLLFATHAHTIATCSTVVSVLCHLFLFPLKQ